MSKIVLACEQLSKRYQDGKTNVSVLENVSLQIPEAKAVAIIGQSGSGKSTLLHLLGGLDSPTEGSVEVDGVQLNRLSETAKGDIRNQKLGFIYQFHHLLAEFNAIENVAMPLLIRGLKRDEAYAKAADIVKKVGLSHRESHRPAELSGGERQRIAIARALVTEPLCVLADEPTGNLDSKNAQAVMEMMLSLRDSLNTSLVVVTHDSHMSQQMEQVYELVDGRLHEGVSV